MTYHFTITLASKYLNMKIPFFFLFLFFFLSLTGQETQAINTKSNSKKISRQGKFTIRSFYIYPYTFRPTFGFYRYGHENRYSYYGPNSIYGGSVAWKLRASNQVIEPNSLNFRPASGREERVFFKSEGDYHLALMDVEARYFNKKKEPVKIQSGEKVQILKKGAWDYKIIYDNKKLYVKRQYYFPSLEENKNKEMVSDVEDSPQSSSTRETGKCYAKSLVASEYQIDTVQYIVYTGNSKIEKSKLEQVKIIVSPPSSKWVKTMPNEKCLSADPNDCLVWTLVDIPEEIIEYTTLKDTTQSKEFEIRACQKYTLVKERGFSKYIEVICNNRITPDFIKELQISLKKNGFYHGLLDGKFEELTKEALSKYQRNNNLTLGVLDLETLNELGLSTSN